MRYFLVIALSLLCARIDCMNITEQLEALGCTDLLDALSGTDVLAELEKEGT